MASVGLIAAASGALAGGGAGLEKVGEFGMREQLAQHMSDLAQKREEAITKLRAYYEQQQQATGIRAQYGLEKQREAGEFKRTGLELKARSGAAAAQRTFESSKAHEHETAATERTRITAASRVDAAAIRGSASQKTTQNKRFTPIRLQSSTIDPVTKIPSQTQRALLFDQQGGRMFELVGDKYIPYDEQRQGPVDPKQFGRPNATDLQYLLSNMDKQPELLDKFMRPTSEGGFGFLPQAAVSRLQAPPNTSQSQAISLPSGQKWTPPSGHTGTVGESFGPDQASQDAAHEAELEAESDRQEAEDAEPPAPSGQLGAYDSAAPNG